MRRVDDILNTVRMLEEENLDVRTVTMGLTWTAANGRASRRHPFKCIKESNRMRAILCPCAMG